MRTLEQIKNEYARINYYYSWESMIRVYVKHEDINKILKSENEVMQIYAMECLLNASDNYSKHSITNEDNIIK